MKLPTMLACWSWCAHSLRSKTVADDAALLVPRQSRPLPERLILAPPAPMDTLSLLALHPSNQAWPAYLAKSAGPACCLM